MKRAMVQVVGVLAAAAVTGAPVATRADCAEKPTASLVLPEHGTTVGPRAHIFLMVWRQLGKLSPTLVHGPEGAEVALRVVPRRPSGLVRLVPRRPLRPGGYEVRLGDEAVGRFRVDRRRRVRRRQPAAVAGAKIVFSAPTKASSLWKGGRSAEVEVTAGTGRRPDLLELQLSYSSGKLGIKSGLAARFAPRLKVASGAPCSRLPAAPVDGSYTLKLVPWSLGGKAGRPALLTGTIR